jgi:D-glycero-alpha-D-manno-heptose 1-phosphate guanylyltransferase
VTRLTNQRTTTFPTAVILAGGLGTRLRSAFSTGPKSLAPVNGRPFLDYLLRWLNAEGVQEAVLCVGYKRSQIEDFVQEGRNWGLRVSYSIEEELLGTGGAIKKAEPLISGDRAFVLNGDTFLEVNLSEMLDFHRRKQSRATLAVTLAKDKGRYGGLELDWEGRIIRFSEKAGSSKAEGEGNGETSINGGVYLIESQTLSQIPPNVAVSLEKEVLPNLVASGAVYGFRTRGYFLDIGVPDDFERAQIELPERKYNRDSR